MQGTGFIDRIRPALSYISDMAGEELCRGTCEESQRAKITQKNDFEGIAAVLPMQLILD